MTMMGLGMEVWESRRARKRPTQPPPEITMGREVVVDEFVWPFEVVPLDRPFVVLPLETPFAMPFVDASPLVVSLVTAISPVEFDTIV
jgi:hypothetical protein